MQPELFLSCDWGTSRFRLRLAEVETGRALAETTSDAGVAQIAAENEPAARPDVYRLEVLAGLAKLQSQSSALIAGLPLVISGMASSSLGWCELPYAKLPFALSGEHAVWQELEPLSANSGTSRVFLISGVSSDDDVIRGEETELLGAWRFAPRAEDATSSMVILPGTHSKHLEIRQNSLVGFRTYMTGELFDVVGRHSVLRHSLPAKHEVPAAWRSELRQAFATGVQLGSERPLSNALFLVRTKSILAGQSPAESEAYLSGILVGAELSSLLRYGVEGISVLLCAGGELATRYELAFETLRWEHNLAIVPAADVVRLATLGQAVLLKQMLAKS